MSQTNGDSSYWFLLYPAHFLYLIRKRTVGATSIHMYTRLSAWLVSLLATSSYVFAIHVSVPSNIKERARDDPIVIKFRLKRVTMICSGWILLLPLILKLWGGYNSKTEVIRSLGLLPGLTKSRSLKSDLEAVGYTVVQFCILFIGPILEYARGAWCKETSISRDFRDSFILFEGFRNYVFAPLTEELIYRSVVLTLMYPTHITTSTLLLTPLFFGLAHIHHAYALVKDGRNSFSNIIIATFFQAFYTTLFGILSNYVFLRSKHNLSCSVLAHTICNLNGIPEISVKGGRWTKVYRVLLIVGAFGFYYSV